MDELFSELKAGAFFYAVQFPTNHFLKCETFSCGQGIFNCVSVGELYNHPFFFADNAIVRKIL